MARVRDSLSLCSDRGNLDITGEQKRMPKLDDIARDPTYDARASQASKNTIFVFAATFAYMLFFSGVSPGVTGGLVFFTVGIFAVSLLIAMPLFLLRLKFPSLGIFLSIIDAICTLWVTREVYLWMFATPGVSR
jgi:hypothetical protein